MGENGSDGAWGRIGGPGRGEESRGNPPQHGRCPGSPRYFQVSLLKLFMHSASRPYMIHDFST